METEGWQVPLEIGGYERGSPSQGRCVVGLVVEKDLWIVQLAEVGGKFQVEEKGIRACGKDGLGQAGFAALSGNEDGDGSPIRMIDFAEQASDLRVRLRN